MRNTNTFRRLAFATLAIAVLTMNSADSFAQSGNRSSNRNTTSQKRMTMQKQAMQKKAMQKQAMQKKAMQEGTVGLEGYCPVCVVAKSQWVKGSPEFASKYDGTTYYFPSDEVKAMFDANPVAFVPVLGGDCIVCYAKDGKTRAPGNIRFASLTNERLFLFPNDEIRQMFNKSPETYVNRDLGADGNCIVCKVKAGKIVPGSEKFTAVHNGFRYQFPSDSERQMFVASPADFVDADSKMMKQGMEKNAMKDDSKMMKTSMKTTTIQVQGKTACAACEFGVTPINAPDELGLAVTTTDGQIYVIEESHTRWPQLYKDRFAGKQVAVSGSVIKTKGNITWIKPSDLKTL